MKKLSLIFAGLFMILSAGMVHAADSGSAEGEDYIPWTWDDVED